MISIMFVDDEPSILHGIRRVARSMRPEWDMHFCEGGDEALALLREVEVDVVISDMRMPGMDGAELLARVREVSPGSARIMLSGFAEQEAVFRSTRVAHQFLSKPCDIDELRETIRRISECRSAVQPAKIRDVVGRVEELPALGNVYAELMLEIESPSSSNESLGAIIEKDAALTAEVLRLVNSTFFGLLRGVSSVSQAIGFLGFDVVRAIVVGHSLFDGQPNPVIDIADLGSRARSVASLARRTVKLEGGTVTQGAEAFLAGMLHEVGALVLAQLPDVDHEVLRAVLGSNDLMNERLEFEVDRFMTGGYLLGLWGFSPAIVDAISSQSDTHGPPETPIGRALGLSCRILHAPIDLSVELTDSQLTDVLLAAEENTLADLDLTGLAA